MKKDSVLGMLVGLVGLGATVFVIGYAFSKGSKVGAK